MQSDAELISLLQQRGLKATPQRLTIYRYLANNDTHPSADMIYDFVKKELPTISPGTVYKTLSTLTKIGVIRELNIDGHSHYDSNTEVHINLICPECHHITDYQSDEVLSFWETISSDIGGEITGQRFDVYRMCDNCRTTDTNL